MPYSQTPYDQELHDLCIRECNLKKYPIDKIHGNSSIAKYIPLGVVITSTAYGHLKSRSIQVFVALYTAFNIWVEDTARNAKGVETFNERFVSGEKQANEGFHGFDRFLRETNIHYHGIQAHVIVTTTLFYMSSISLEIETQGTPVSFIFERMDDLKKILSLTITGFTTCQVRSQLYTRHVEGL